MGAAPRPCRGPAKEPPAGDCPCLHSCCPLPSPCPLAHLACLHCWPVIPVREAAGLRYHSDETIQLLLRRREGSFKQEEEKMGRVAGVKFCLRVTSDLHHTTTPSPAKVTPKSKGRSQLVKQERVAQSHPVSHSRRSAKQSRASGRAPGRWHSHRLFDRAWPAGSRALRHPKAPKRTFLPEEQGR